MGDERIGERVRRWRHRRGGMTQAALAGLAGVSQPYIAMIENGTASLDRKQTQVRIANALNISVAQLLGDPDAVADPMRERALVHVPAIRAVLVELSVGETRRPQREPDQIRAAVRDLTDLRNSADYAALAPVLPQLLLDIAGHGGAMTPSYVEALFCARYALKSMGHADLGRQAADIAWRAALEYDDPAWAGQAVYNLVQAFPAESAELGTTLLERQADLVQTDPSRSAREVYGCLHILAGYQAAIARRAADAAAHLAEASDIANALGEPERYAPVSAGFNGNWFGTTQVDVWRVAVAAELGDAGAAMSVGERIDLQTLPVPNRHVYYHTDYARALAAEGRDIEAMHALARAERSAPQHFRFNRVARDLVATLITRAKRRAVTEEMTALARTLGLQPI